MLAAWPRIWGAIAGWADFGIATVVAVLSRTLGRVLVAAGCLGACGAFAMVGMAGGQAQPEASVFAISRGPASVILVKAERDPAQDVAPTNATTAAVETEAPVTATPAPIATPASAPVAAAAATAVATPLPAPTPAPTNPAVATSAPAAPVATAATGRRFSADEVRDAARSAGWPESLLDQVVAVAKCESGFYSGAQGGGALGLMQIMPPWFESAGVPLSSWTDPVANLAVARYVYNHGGGSWSAWGCSP